MGAVDLASPAVGLVHLDAFPFFCGTGYQPVVWGKKHGLVARATRQGIMRMRTSMACAVAMLLCWCGSVRAEDKAPDEVLKSQGLTKVGITYLLEGDIKLPEALRAMRQAKKQCDAYAARKSDLERKVQMAMNATSQLEAEYRNVLAQQDAVKNIPFRYNQLVGRANALQGQIREALQFAQDREKDLSRQADPQDKYMTALIDLSDQMESTATKYAELAGDPEVTGAISRLNEKSKAKLKLGPSAQFAAELPRVRRQREMIVAAPVKIMVVAGIPHVTATLNGKLTQVMLLDSGASAVSITWAMAQQAGVTPGPDDPSAKVSIANGSVVDAKVMVLKSVQVGPFIAHDVECFVLPESVKDADGLLGGSFLRNFVYKMDLAAGELHMSQIAPKAGAPAPKPGSNDKHEQATDAPSAAGPAGSGAGSFAIPSSDGWTPVSFNVQAGKCYHVKARGKWTGSTGLIAGPEGLCPPQFFAVLGPQPGLGKEQQGAYYIGQHPRSALIGRIGSQQWTFYVGADCRFIAPVSGQLSFRMNDTNSASEARGGKVDVTITPITPQWLAHGGQVEVLARIDDTDKLHLTPRGPYWEWGGQWGKVGLHEGYYPTVINGIFWWPRWVDDRHTETLAAPELWPRTTEHFRLAKVEAKRGSVDVLDHPADEIVLRFRDNGLGSSQVGCVFATGR